MAEVADFLHDIKIPMTIAHVITVVVGMGAALVSDLIFNFYASDKRLNKTEQKTLERLSAVVWYSLVLIALSGFGLFFSDMPKYLASAKFLAKLTILCVLVLNGVMLNFRVWPHLARPGFFTARAEKWTRKLAFVGGAISVISWVSVCALGVLDKSPTTYKILMLAYGAIVVIGSCAALAMESWQFERKQAKK